MVMSDAGATAAAARQTVERPLTLSPGEVVEMGGGGSRRVVAAGSWNPRRLLCYPCCYDNHAGPRS